MNPHNMTPAPYRIPVLSTQDLKRVGYETRDGDSAVLLHLTNPDLSKHAVIIEGAPGVGKTELAKALQRAISAKLLKEENTDIGCAYIETLFHSWTSNDDLFSAPHVGNIAVGVTNPLDAYKKGVLWLAAIESWKRPVVLLLDEFEKCQQRSEYLILSFLEDGRVQDSDPAGDGNEVYADLSNIIVVLTTNGTRELHEATKRRAMRYRMDYLSPAVESQLLRKMTGAPVSAITTLVKAANEIRKSGTSSPSIQEMSLLLLDARHTVNEAEAAVLVRGLLCKTEQDMTIEAQATLGAALYGAFGQGGN